MQKNNGTEQCCLQIITKIAFINHFFPTTHSIKEGNYWDTAPCSLAEVDKHFKGAYCLHHQGGESVCFYETTRRNIPDGCHLHTCRRENLNSH
jgi:hypothetical protein